MAKISPSGFYCASADIGGVVKIWSTDNPEHPVKFEGQILAGAVTDLQWSPDSQLVVAVGDGRECFGKVFAWDTGNEPCNFGYCWAPLMLTEKKQVPPAESLQVMAKKFCLVIFGQSSRTESSALLRICRSPLTRFILSWELFKFSSVVGSGEPL